MDLRRTSRRGSALALLVLLTGLASAPAATFTVTKTADTYDTVCDSDCSLREAIVAANDSLGADTIMVPAGTYPRGQQVAGEDAGTSGDYDIADSVTILGAGARSTIISASEGTTSATDRVLQVLGGDVVLHGMTIADGRAGADDGGGILNWATLRLEGVAVVANRAAYGGGIENAGDLVIDGATVSDNRASADGGGIDSSGTLTTTNLTVSGNKATGSGGGLVIDATAALTNATIAYNSADSLGGGLLADDGTTLHNTLLIGNNAATLPGNCSGASAPTSAGNNIDTGSSCALSGSGDQSNSPITIRSLRDNGGQLNTHSIYADGPAFDRGGTTGCPATDARGLPRPQGTACDVGAFELDVADLVVSVAAAQSTVASGGQAAFTVTVRNTSTAPAVAVSVHVGVINSAGFALSSDRSSCVLTYCTSESLGPGEAWTIAVPAQARTLSPVSQPLPLQLTATAQTRSVELDTGDNEATAASTIQPPPLPPPVSPVKLSLSAAPKQRLKRHVLAVKVTCDAACTPRARVDLLRRGGKIVRLGTITGKPVAARVTQALKLRLSKRAIGSLRKALRGHRSVSVRFVITASTTVPGRTTGARTVTVKVIR